MRRGMKESADESDLACFRSPNVWLALTSSQVQVGGGLPKMTLQQFKTHMILSLGARYDLILRSSEKGQQTFPTVFSGQIQPCWASLKKRFPLSPTGGMSKCCSRTHP